MEKKCGIYIIKNKINDNIYIGQSVDIHARWYAHLRSSQGKAQDSFTQLHQAMQKLGASNFFCEILEECPIELLNEKEIYYIKEYDSYYHGYNMTLGGESNHYETNPRSILTLEQVQEIRLMYNAHIPFRDAYKKYCGVISKSGFKKVWSYQTWRGILPEVYSDENKKWHETYAKSCINGNTHIGKNNTLRACSQEEIDKMRKLRSEGLSYSEISRKTNRSIGVVRKYCLHREAASPQACGKAQPKAVPVRNIETGLVFESSRQAAEWAGVKDKGKRIRDIVLGNKENYTSGKVQLTNQPAHWELA